jgi:hypothetical protein
MTRLELFLKVREMVEGTEETFEHPKQKGKSWGICEFIEKIWLANIWPSFYVQKEIALMEVFIFEKGCKIKGPVSRFSLYWFQTKTDRLEFLDLYIKHLKQSQTI